MQTFLACLAVLVSLIFATITLDFSGIWNMGNYGLLLALYIAATVLPVLATKFFSKEIKS